MDNSHFTEFPTMVIIWNSYNYHTYLRMAINTAFERLLIIPSILYLYSMTADSLSEHSGKLRFLKQEKFQIKFKVFLPYQSTDFIDKKIPLILLLLHLSFQYIS